MLEASHLWPAPSDSGRDESYLYPLTFSLSHVLPSHSFADFAFNQATTEKWGVQEAYDSLLEKGCDPNLFSKQWVSNHFRWIVWKLASIARRSGSVEYFSQEAVLSQLLYRYTWNIYQSYEREINRAERSSLKLICEKDSSPARHLVLFISKLSVSNTGSLDFKVSDGWYEIGVELDNVLRKCIDSEKLFLGQKLHILGAEVLIAINIVDWCFGWVSGS